MTILDIEYWLSVVALGAFLVIVLFWKWKPPDDNDTGWW